MKTCPLCAEEVQDAAIRCRWCHNDLLSDATAKSASPSLSSPTPVATNGAFALGPAAHGQAPVLVGVPAVKGSTPGSGQAVAALVLGIVGFLIPIVCSILAIVFGAIGINNANIKASPGKGMAIAGLVLGIVGLLAGIAILSGA